MHNIQHYDSAGRPVEWIYLHGKVAPERDCGEGRLVAAYTRNEMMKNHPYRPYFSHEGYYWTVSEPLYGWLCEQDCTYVIQWRWTYDRLGWYIGVHDKSKAALCKLTWSEL